MQRISSIKKAISYCGLCGDEQRSANSWQRTPISKQRNKHLQTTLIEAAKMAPRYRRQLTSRSQSWRIQYLYLLGGETRHFHCVRIRP